MCGFYVEEHAKEQYTPDTVDLRAVGIIRCFDLGVMLAMHGHPFFGDHACGQPQPESEEVTDHGLQVKRVVCLVTMEVDRDANNRDVGECQCDQRVAPPRQSEKS